MVTEITMDDIKNGLTTERDDLIILMFYGPTCGPCKATMPNYEDAARFYIEKTSKIHCMRINAWEPQDQADYCKSFWKVEGVPHFKTFCRGEELTSKIGGGDLDTMKQFIHSAIDTVFKKFDVRI
jgi:thiol-disulfide isomerase/thioredoxin